MTVPSTPGRERASAPDGPATVAAGAAGRHAPRSRGVGYGRVYSGLTGVLLGSLAGLNAGERFGSSLAAGDFDGDGAPDLLVGVPYAPGNGRVDLF